MPSFSYAHESCKSVDVIALKPLASAGNLKAFVSIKLGGVTLHDCRIVQPPGQRAWVSLPQGEYVKDGERKYAAIVELSEPLRREVQQVVLAA